MTTPQQHAEALEQALAALPPELNALGIYNFHAWTSYVHAANPDAICSLLDERKRLRDALELIRDFGSPDLLVEVCMLIYIQRTD